MLVMPRVGSVKRGGKLGWFGMDADAKGQAVAAGGPLPVVGFDGLCTDAVARLGIKLRCGTCVLGWYLRTLCGQTPPPFIRHCPS